MNAAPWRDRRIGGQVLALICPECGAMVPPVEIGGLTQIDWPKLHTARHILDRPPPPEPVWVTVTVDGEDRRMRIGETAPLRGGQTVSYRGWTQTMAADGTFTVEG